MREETKKTTVTIIVADDDTGKRQQLTDRLISTLSDPDTEPKKVPPFEEEGKPKTPLPKHEEPSDPEDDDLFAEDNDLRALEPETDKETVKNRTCGFLVGLFTGWLVTGAGILSFRLARAGLKQLMELTELPADVLIGLCMMTVLALLFRRKTRQFVAKVIDWFDLDF